MAEITVANIEGEILDDLQSALAAATVSSVDFFDAVYICASEESVKDKRFTSPKFAAIICDEITEGHAASLRRTGHVMVTLLVAFKGDEGEGTAKGALGLAAGARNAIESTPPSDASAVNTDDQYGEFHEPLEWGEITLVDDKEPWMIAKIPLTINFSIASRTSH